MNEPPPMRVLHVASGDLWAGAEVQAYTLLRALQATAGIEVSAALLNEGELARRLRTAGIPVHVFSETDSSAARILMGLRTLMSSWRPDIVHTHRIKENVLGSFANLLARRAPCVRTVHGAAEHGKQGLLRLHRRLFHHLDHWCARLLQDRVVAVSAELKQKLSVSLPAEKVIAIENGVDIAATRAQVATANFRANAPAGVHVGLVGRLVGVKRADLFLATAASLRRSHTHVPWHFHLIGEGPLAGPMKELANGLSLGSSVTFHGHRSDVVSCISSLDLLMLTSDHEGLPMVALEALAVGTPVIAHAVGGLVELMRGAGSCVLVADQDAQVYADAVLASLASPRERNVFEFDAAIRRYSAAANASRMTQLYRELHDGSRSKPTTLDT